MSRVKWGKGKVEVFALRSEILELLSQGQNQTEIYQTLLSQSKLTVGMRTFSRHVKAMIAKNKELHSNSSYPLNSQNFHQNSSKKSNNPSQQKACFSNKNTPTDSNDW